MLIWGFKAELDVCEAYTSKTASWTDELNHKLGGARKITSGGLTMDRDLNGVCGIFLHVLADNPGSVNTDLADADAFLADIERSGTEALTPPIQTAPLLIAIASGSVISEQFFCRMKPFPRIAVRYEKLAGRLLACAALVAFPMAGLNVSRPSI